MPIYPFLHNLADYQPSNKLFFITCFDSTYPGPDAVCDPKRIPLLTFLESVSIYCDPLYPASLPSINPAHTSCYVAKNCLTQGSLVFRRGVGGVGLLTPLIKITKTIYQLCTERLLEKKGTPALFSVF